jgi:eukaryotic-like serine/threonine-protein kinase
MVADFGQSRKISSTGVVSVPDLYFSSYPPETVKTGVATKLADIYQVGLLLNRALNGDQWYNAQIPTDQADLMKMIEHGKFPDRDRFMPHVPKRLRTLTRKALQVDPTRRFQSATEMANALNRVDLRLNWISEPRGGGGICWRASRPGQAELVVELVNQSPTWSVQSATERNGQRRAKGKTQNWRRGLNLSAAHAHLKKLFEGLP